MRPKPFLLVLAVVPLVALLLTLFRGRSSAPERPAPGRGPGRAVETAPADAKPPTPERALLPAARQPGVEVRDVEARYVGPDLTRFQRLSKTRQAKELADVFEWEKVVLDPKADSYHRSHAFAKLADRGALSEETVASATALLASAPPESSQRALLSASLKARADRIHVQEALLARLRADSNEMVRKRAAESLILVRADPRVRTSLEAALRSDPSEFVRKAIQRVLESR